MKICTAKFGVNLMPTNDENNLNSLRLKITDVDAEIMKLVAKRLQLARLVGRIKHTQQSPVSNPQVEEQVLATNRKLGNKLKLPTELTRKLTELLIDYAVSEQTPEATRSLPKTPAE